MPGVGETSASICQIEERLALHELIRVGFGRGEDLQLLQAVVTQEPPAAPPASQQLLRECQLREEWRCMNEAKLLAQVQATNFVSINDAARLELAARVQQALQQMRGRSTMPHPARAPARSSVAPGSMHTSELTAFGAQQAAHRGKAMPRPKSATLPSRTALTPTKAPRVPGPGTQLFTPQQLRSQLGACVLSPTTPAARAQQQQQHHHHNHTTSHFSPRSDPRQPPLAPSARLRNSTPSGSGNAQQQHPCTSTSPASGGPSRALGRLGVGSPGSSAATPRSPAASLSSSSSSSSSRAGTAGALAQEPPPLPQNRLPTPNQGSHHLQQQPPAGADRRLVGAAAQLKARPHSARAALPAKPQSAQDGGRYEAFLRLQGNLLEGLQQHASAGGTQSALQALQQSVGHMQAHFQACLSQASEALGVPLHLQGKVQAAHTVGSNPRGWYQLLLLGQLGLTPKDTARLQLLRKQQAARTIQRMVRWYLPIARHRRQVQAARERARALAHQLQCRAATIIQCHWRGAAGRRAAAALRRLRLEQFRKDTVQHLVRRLAATRIQRAWRLHQKRRRASLACLPPGRPCLDPRGGSRQGGPGSGPAQGADRRDVSHEGQPEVGPLAAAMQEEPAVEPAMIPVWGSAGRRGLGEGKKAPTAPQEGKQPTQQPQQQQQQQAADAAHRLQGPPCAAGTPPPCRGRAGAAAAAAWSQEYTLRQQAAAVCVQAAVRGWLCRRSKELWWKHCSRDIRGRRSMARVWKAHHRFMRDTYDQQAQILRVVLHEAQASEALLAQCTRDRAAFEVAWEQWMARQCKVAVAQPLPKGWVPFTKPHTDEACFLDTKTGAMHAHHPALLQLQPFAMQERSKAEEQLSVREADMAKQLHTIHLQSGLLQRNLLHKLSAQN